MRFIHHKVLYGLYILWSIWFLIDPTLNLKNNGKFLETLPVSLWVWILGSAIFTLFAVLFHKFGGGQAVAASFLGIWVILWFVNLLFPWVKGLMMFNPFCWPLLWKGETVALDLYSSFLLYLLVWTLCLGIVIISAWMLCRKHFKQ